MPSINDSIRSLMLPLKIFEGLVPLKQIDELMPTNGVIVDLGCGEGFYAISLAENKKRDVIGIDNNKKTLPTSNKANLKFRLDDIRKFSIKDVSGILLSDVLHHLPFPDQDKVLHKASNSLRSKGVLIIKEIDTKEFIRSKMSRFWDFVYFPKDKIYYNNSKDLQMKLKKLRFTVNISRPSRLMPGSTTLFFCIKK